MALVDVAPAIITATGTLCGTLVGAYLASNLIVKRESEARARTAVAGYRLVADELGAFAVVLSEALGRGVLSKVDLLGADVWPVYREMLAAGMPPEKWHVIAAFSKSNVELRSRLSRRFDDLGMLRLTEGDMAAIRRTVEQVEEVVAILDGAADSIRRPSRRRFSSGRGRSSSKSSV